MSKVISVLNMKGGVGKTTLSFNLAEELARRNKVLLIDLDPQSSLTQFVLGEEKAIDLHRENEPTIFDLFKNDKLVNPNEMLYKKNLRLCIIPSSLHLSKALIYAHDKVILGFNKFIKMLKRDYDFDFIVIDCPPFESVFNRATYHVSDYIINPVTVSKFSILGMYLLKDSMDEYCDLYNTTIKGGTVINAFDSNDTSINYLQLISSIEKGVEELENAQFLDWSLFDTKVLFSKSHKTSVFEGTSLRRTSYCKFKVKDNFKLFVDELVQKLS